MRLFIILSRVPWPLEKGDKLRAYYQIRELSRYHDVSLFCLSDTAIDPKAKTELLRYCKEVHIERIRRPGILFRLAKAVFSKLPFQVHYFYKPSLKSKVHSIIREFNAEHIYCQLIRCSEYVKNIHHIPKTLDYMDAFSKGVERRIASAPFGIRSIFKTEARRLVEYENLIFDYFENKTIITEQDKRFIYHPDQQHIHVIPNGVDVTHFSPMERKKKYEIVFNGNMNYPPNIDCVEYIAKEILPLLPPTTRFLISGASPAGQVLELRENSQITVSGWVDDQRESYASGKVFLAPFRIGTGLQNKLLEAMSMGIPCVTSTLANNALGAEPGRQILIGDSPTEIADLVAKLLNDKDRAAAIAEEGKSFVHSRYNWESSCLILNNLITGK
ncbi:MAG TPA: glycosyltransferase [Flavobacteriales bacterium]|nr:glycosyltransferase [Flavobacteriales bacterium]HRJ36825.1 glycosyltransferase [Flavobacteriales bacterium]HRJ40166.1 glycosyltransferase [Flavobacteriales bacterium]